MRPKSFAESPSGDAFVRCLGSRLCGNVEAVTARRDTPAHRWLPEAVHDTGDTNHRQPGSQRRPIHAR